MTVWKDSPMWTPERKTMADRLKRGKRKRPYSVMVDGPEGKLRITVPIAAMNTERAELFDKMADLASDLLSATALAPPSHTEQEK